MKKKVSKKVVDEKRANFKKQFLEWVHTLIKVLRYAGTRFEEQRQLHLPQNHKATVADSTLRVEMNGLEETRGASRQRQGPRALLEAPLMARHHQAHIRQRCLRPSALGDFCIHDARFGGPHPCRPPPPPQ